MWQWLQTLGGDDSVITVNDPSLFTVQFNEDGTLVVKADCKGTTGTYTRQTKKTFFERQRAKQLARKARFSDRVKKRVRRSRMSGFRSRSFRGGK